MSDGVPERGPALDLHAHLLPGVDDGACDAVETLGMLQDAISERCGGVVASSHLWENLFDTSVELIREEYTHVVELVERENLPIEVFPGAENFLDESDDPEEFAERAVPIGPGEHYVLFDFTMRYLPPNVADAVAALDKCGKRAVIAHPERNLDIQRDPAPVSTWIDRGAIIQMNGPSLLGMLGTKTKRAAEILLAAGAVHLLASDAHNRKRRPFCLWQAREIAESWVGEEEANRLVIDRPWKIVRGEPIDPGKVQLTSPSVAEKLFRRLFAS